MRGGRARLFGVGLAATTACTAPEPGAGDSTTAVVASFGEDTIGTTPTDPSPTGSPTSAPTTSTTASEVSTDPTVDPTAEPTAEATATSETSAATRDETSDAEGSSSTGEPPEPPPPPCAMVTATIRDFSARHPDMAMPGGGVILPGLVLPVLGVLGVPELDPAYMGEVSITSADTFTQWYADVVDVNVPFDVELGVWEESPGRIVYDDLAFLPIDDQGFGNEGETNNFFFTTEIHTEVVYQGGEVMTFGGDDDVWVFVDGILAADVGGQHAAIYVDVALDDLGLEPGLSYALDVFHAERGVGNSRLRFELGGFCG